MRTNPGRFATAGLLAGLCLAGCATGSGGTQPEDAGRGSIADGASHRGDAPRNADARLGDAHRSDAHVADAFAGDRGDERADDADVADAHFPDGGADHAVTDGGSADSGSHDAVAPIDAKPLPTALPLGANVPPLFLGFLNLSPGGPAAQISALDDAKAAGITHVRFIASGYYPNDMATGSGWIANPTAYWAAFDDAVNAAYAHGIRLVPSMLWNLYLFPDLAGEPTGKLFVPGSKTRTLAEKYITELVTRYAKSDAILFWELGNELNLSADIDVSTCSVCDGGTNGCGALNPPGGTPCERTAADEFYSCNVCRGASGPEEDLGQFTADIAALVHSIDPVHPFSSGDGYPRSSAWHLAASPCPGCDWTLDSQSDYQKALLALHPDGVDVISVHHYPSSDLERFGSNDHTGAALLALTQTIATGAGRTLYIGEYGEAKAGSTSCNGTTVCGGEATAGSTHWVLDDIVGDKIPYASIWALDFFQFCAGVPTCFTVTPGDAIVSALSVHDDAMTSCTGKADGTPCPIGACTQQICKPIAGATYTFTQPSDIASWLSWTNCSGCALGTDRVVTPANYFELQSNDLPCIGACNYAGVYALGPSFPVSGTHVLARIVARSTAAAAAVDFITFDSSNTEVGQISTPVAAGSTFTSSAFYFTAPAGAATAQIRLELTAPTSTFDIEELDIVVEP